MAIIVAQTYYQRDLHIFQARFLKLLLQAREGVLEGALHIVGFLHRWVLRSACRHLGDCQAGGQRFGKNVTLRETARIYI